MSSVVIGQDPEVRIGELKRQIAAHQREQVKLLQKRTRAERAGARLGHKEWTGDQQRKLQHLPGLIQKKNLEILRLVAAMKQT